MINNDKKGYKASFMGGTNCIRIDITVKLYRIRIILLQPAWRTMKLPKSVQQIADVIGVSQTMKLIGMLPVCKVRDKRYSKAISNRIVLIVPANLKPDDKLVRMIGWEDAYKLSRHFGGEFLYPATCAEIYRDFLKDTATRMHSDGMKPAEVADAMQIPYRTISRWLSNAIPHHAAACHAGKISPATGTNEGKERDVVN